MRTRTLLLAIAAALLVAAAPAQAHGGHHANGHHQRHKPRAVDVQLLSINDFHGNLAPPGTITLPGGVRTPAGGAEYLATHVNDLRKQNRNTLVVSAGDNIGASPLVSGLFHDEPTIEAFNAMGVDISSVGNHEFDEGSAELLRMQDGGCHPVDGCQDGDGFAGADFDYLAANVTDDDTGKTLFRPYEIRRVGGVKVGFIGVVLKDTPTIVTPSGVEGLTFGDEAEAINKYTAILKKKGVRAVVVLMHQGDTVDLGQVNDCINPVGPLSDIIGHSSKEVDLYLTGHTHQAYNCVIAGKRATSASSFGRVLTDANLRIDRRTGQVVSVSATNSIVTQDVAKDPAQTAIIDKYTAISAPIANKRIGATTAALTREQNAAGESVLGDVIADSQLADTASATTGNAVVAFMNPGGIRTDIDAGDITFADAFAVQPFGNSLVTMTLTGAQIDRALEQQWDGQGTSPKVLQVSGGFTYTWSASGPLGSRVDPSTIKINGVTVDPAATYRVTVNSFLADGGDGFTILKSGTDRLGGDVDVDALAASTSGAHDPISPTPRDRITSGPVGVLQGGGRAQSTQCPPALPCRRRSRCAARSAAGCAASAATCGGSCRRRSPPERRGSSPTCCIPSRSSPRPPRSSRWACRAAGARCARSSSPPAWRSGSSSRTSSSGGWAPTPSSHARRGALDGRCAAASERADPRQPGSDLRHPHRRHAAARREPLAVALPGRADRRRGGAAGRAGAVPARPGAGDGEGGAPGGQRPVGRAEGPGRGPARRRRAARAARPGDRAQHRRRPRLLLRRGRPRARDLHLSPPARAPPTPPRADLRVAGTSRSLSAGLQRRRRSARVINSTRPAAIPPYALFKEPGFAQ